jgi:plasmid stabilization system protein ParE
VKPLHHHPSAESESDDAHDWYLRQSQQAADGFLEELIPALNRIAGQPRLFLSRYPFSVVYRERPNDIQIVAIAHAKRRPGYWSNRL